MDENTSKAIVMVVNAHHLQLLLDFLVLLLHRFLHLRLLVENLAAINIWTLIQLLVLVRDLVLAVISAALVDADELDVRIGIESLFLLPHHE